MPTSIDITFKHYNRPPTDHLHFRVLTRVFQVHLLWRTKECADIRIFSSQLLPARISIFDQNQEAEMFKFRWCRQSEIKDQLILTSIILTRMLHITDINLLKGDQLKAWPAHTTASTTTINDRKHKPNKDLWRSQPELRNVHISKYEYKKEGRSLPLFLG